MIFVLLGRTFSSNKDVDGGDVNVLDGRVLLRLTLRDDDGDEDEGADENDRIGTDADLRNMILLRLISPRATGEERNSSSSSMTSSLLPFDSKSNGVVSVSMLFTV